MESYDRVGCACSLTCVHIRHVRYYFGVQGRAGAPRIHSSPSLRVYPAPACLVFTRLEAPEHVHLPACDVCVGKKYRS